MVIKEYEVVVVGGGPAGLRAAELESAAGKRVALYEGKRSVGRKFLVAGKGGLNLTHGEDKEQFCRRYRGPGQPEGCWERWIGAFDAQAMRAWAAGLGVETKQARTGRVYPVEMKAAPLLRAWVGRLKEQGVVMEMNQRWVGLEGQGPYRLRFEQGEQVVANEVIFALGGGSWPQTGSDGSWIEVFREMGIACRDFEPANCGWRHGWSEQVLALAEGKPIKNVRVGAGGQWVEGELMVTRYGLEGGAIYQLGPELRGMARPVLEIDLKPTFSVAQLVAKMESVRRGYLEEARVRWKLGEAAYALLSEQEWGDAKSLAEAVKAWQVPLEGPQPLDEAISSAGGVCWSELDERLMVKRMPGVYVIGEMVDWEAPTGGYLMQGCFAMAQGRGGRKFEI